MEEPSFVECAWPGDIEQTFPDLRPSSPNALAVQPRSIATNRVHPARSGEVCFQPNRNLIDKSHCPPGSRVAAALTTWLNDAEVLAVNEALPL